MKYTAAQKPSEQFWPTPWRLILVALCAVILCSCRAPGRTGAPTGMTGGQQMQNAGSLPPQAYADAAMACPTAYAENGTPMPYQPQGPWSPPGISKPWPADEYIRDGGDIGVQAMVSGQGELGGLEMEDTVACYDTLDGRTVVEPSNKVYLYAPRFGAVRQVVGLVANEEHVRVGGVHLPEHLETPTAVQPVADAEQNIQAVGESSARPAVAMLSKKGTGAMSTVIHPRGFQDAFKPYENLSIIRQGVYEGTDRAFLARGAQAAVTWAGDQAVQVIIDGTGAMAEVKYDRASSLHTVSLPPGKPQLQLVKVASTSFANPGDEVYFTLRFDNLGNQPLGNVVILDSLNTRLEYVADSAQCSVKAKFSTQPNEGESVVFRCELLEPLEPGKGGILRFRCRVR